MPLIDRDTRVIIINQVINSFIPRVPSFTTINFNIRENNVNNYLYTWMGGWNESAKKTAVSNYYSIVLIVSIHNNLR